MLHLSCVSNGNSFRYTFMVQMYHFYDTLNKKIKKSGTFILKTYGKLPRKKNKQRPQTYKRQ